MNQRIVIHFLEDVIEAVDAIERFVLQMDIKQFQDDEKTIRAIEREFEIIGEAVKNIPEAITKDYQAIPWKAIAGMRDRLIHNYWNTEIEILWKTIKESLPPLKSSIIKIIKEIQKDNN